MDPYGRIFFQPVYRVFFHALTRSCTFLYVLVKAIS